jgi:signal transduction histidine kinase
LIIVTITPLVAVAALGGWLLDAERVVLANERRALAKDRAVYVAAEIDLDIRAAIIEKQDKLYFMHAAGDLPALRMEIDSDPLTNLVTLHSPGHNAIFPKQHNSILLRLTRADLALRSARLQLKDDARFIWAGSLRDNGPGVIACRMFDDHQRMCMALDVAAFRMLAGRIVEHALSNDSVSFSLIDDQSPARSDGTVEPIVALLAPLTGWQLGFTSTLEEGRAWSWRFLIIAPLVVISLGGAAAVYFAQTSFATEALQRISMLAQISHELRTPLANLRLYSTLLNDASEKQEAKEYCAVLETETERLSEIVNNALASAKSGTAEPGPPQVESPDNVVHAVLARFRPLWANKLSDVTLDFAASAPARIDVQALERILINLLDNVRRHAPYAAMTIRTAFDGDHLVLTVEDDGGGVPPELRPTLFDAFATSRSDGFGLGLATCRILAEAAGGGIQYVDGKTTACFIVRLKADRGGRPKDE